MESLENLCFSKLETINFKNVKNSMNEHLYNKFVYRLIEKNFNSWKENVKLVNLEINIKEIEAEQDMFLDDLTYHIYVKKKVQDEDEEDYDGEEYCLYHEFHSNNEIYSNYFKIAKKRGLIEEYFEEYEDYDVDEEYEEYEDYKKNKYERNAELIGL